ALAITALVGLVEAYPDVPEYRGQLAACQRRLAWVYQVEGRDVESEALIRKAIQALETIAPRDLKAVDRSRLAACYEHLGFIILNRPGGTAEAEVQFRKDLELVEALC